MEAACVVMVTGHLVAVCGKRLLPGGSTLKQREKASGKDTGGRPQLEKAIDALGKGDILVVAEWDRATRSMVHSVRLIERIGARGAMIRVLDKPHLDLTTPIGKGFIALLSAMASATVRPVR